MIVWIDAQLSPALAPWLSATFGVHAQALRDLGLREARDREIFLRARDANAVVVTKDSDFVTLVESLGPPPRIVWLTLGNTSNVHLRAGLLVQWPKAAALLERDEALVEIQG